MPRARTAVLALSAAVLVMVLRPGLVHAQDAHPRARLAYRRAPGAERCPDEPALRGAVSARLGYDPFEPDAAPQVTTRIAPRGRGLVASIRYAETPGHAPRVRQIASRSRDCDELIHSVALAISIAIDPLSLTRDPPAPLPQPPQPEREPALEPVPVPVPVPVPAPEPAPTTTTATATATAPTPPDPPAPPPLPPPPAPAASPEPPAPLRAEPSVVRAPAPALHPFIAAGLLGDLGLTPGLSFGARVSAGVFRGGFSAALDLAAGSPNTVAHAPGVVGVLPLLVTLAPCARLRFSELCGTLTAGALYGYGQGFTRDRAALLPVLATGVRAGVHARVTATLELFATFDFAVLLTRPVFQLEGDPTFAWKPDPIAADLAVGARLFF